MFELFKIKIGLHTVITPFSVFSVLGKGGGGASHPGWVFLVTSPHPQAHQGHLIRTEDTPITWEAPRGLEGLCRELGPKTKYWNKDALGALTIEEVTRVSGALCQEQGTETDTRFLPSRSHPRSQQAVLVVGLSSSPCGPVLSTSCLPHARQLFAPST